jgi:hypothetical protein
MIASPITRLKLKAEQPQFCDVSSPENLFRQLAAPFRRPAGRRAAIGRMRGCDAAIALCGARAHA